MSSLLWFFSLTIKQTVSQDTGSSTAPVGLQAAPIPAGTTVGGNLNSSSTGTSPNNCTRCHVRKGGDECNDSRPCMFCNQSVSCDPDYFVCRENVCMLDDYEGNLFVCAWWWWWELTRFIPRVDAPYGSSGSCDCLNLAHHFPLEPFHPTTSRMSQHLQLCMHWPRRIWNAGESPMLPISLFVSVHFCYDTDGPSDEMPGGVNSAAVNFEETGEGGIFVVPPRFPLPCICRDISRNYFYFNYFSFGIDW